MTTTQPNINQFALSTVVGQLDLSTQGTVITCQVDSTQVANIKQGQAVKLATTAGGVPKVVSLAANADASFGFACRNLKDVDYAANAYLEVAMINSIMYMEAGAAITRGAKVEVVYTTNKVITNAGTNPVVGFALDAAANSGDQIRVYIITQSYQSAQVIADIAGLQAALDALGDGATQVVTALNTVGAATITAAGIAGGNTSRGGTQTAAWTDTTDTAAAIVAALPNLSVNESFYWTYQNNTAYQATIGGGSGVTPSVQTVVPAGGWVTYLCTYTGTNVFTFVAISAGMMNNTLNNFINGLAKKCTAQLDKATSTAFSTVTGCSVPLIAGAQYIAKAHITGTATANGGAKATLAGDGTLSMTNFSLTGKNYNATTLNAQATTTTLGNPVGAGTAVMTDIDLEAAFTVNVAGVLALQFAQNASHSDTSSAYVNSWLEVTRIA